MSGLCGPDLTHVGRTLGHSPASQVVHIPGLGQHQGGAVGAPARAAAVSQPVLLSVFRAVGGLGGVAAWPDRGLAPAQVWVPRHVHTVGRAAGSVGPGRRIKHRGRPARQPFYKHISEALTFSLRRVPLEAQSLNPTERSPQVAPGVRQAAWVCLSPLRPSQAQVGPQ